MDKKTLKQLTTKIHEEYGFVKKGKYYYLDLEDILICLGFDSMYGVTFFVIYRSSEKRIFFYLYRLFCLKYSEIVSFFICL